MSSPLPPGEYAVSWEVALDTSDAPKTAGITFQPVPSVTMQAHSLAVLNSLPLQP